MRLVEGTSGVQGVYNFGILPKPTDILKVPQLGPRVGQRWVLDHVSFILTPAGPGAYLEVTQGRILHAGRVLQTFDNPLSSADGVRNIPLDPVDGDKTWIPATTFPPMVSGEYLNAEFDMDLVGAPALTEMALRVQMTVFGDMRTDY